MVNNSSSVELFKASIEKECDFLIKKEVDYSGLHGMTISCASPSSARSGPTAFNSTRGPSLSRKIASSPPDT